MQTRPDSVGTIADANESAVVWRGHNLEAEGAWSNDNESSSSPLLTALDAVRLSLTAVADIAIVLAVFPLLIFTGPTQADTTYGAVLPVIILSLCPLLGWMVTNTISSRHWLIVTSLVRVVLAAVILYSPEFPFLSGGFLSIVLAFSWGMRLQETVILTRSHARSRLLNFANYAVPSIALIALLKFYTVAQPYLVSGAIASYATALIVMFLRNATAGTIAANSKKSNWSIESVPGLAAYEILLSVIAGVIVVVPVILLLTDQSAILPTLRSDVIFSLSGWLAGSLLTVLLIRRNTSSSIDRNSAGERRHSAEAEHSRCDGRIKLEHLHLLFTVLLAGLSLCKFPSIAYPLLFLTSAMASSMAIKCIESRGLSGQEANDSNLLLNRPAWQPALTMAVLTIACALAYIDLSPKLSALQPIHVDRTLAALCFIPSLVAVFVWPDSRKVILKLVAYLVPVQNPLNQSFSFYVTKNLEITNAIMIGWRLNAAIVILTTDFSAANGIVKWALQLGNIHALSFNEWRLARVMTLDRMSHGERFLVFDFTGAEVEDISPLSPKAAIGLIERVNDPNAIVISDMVPATKTNLFTSAR